MQIMPRPRPTWGLFGVRKALVVLRDYYAQEGGAAALVQEPAVPQHAKASDSASSIIGILEVVESDFASNLATKETDEETAQDAHDEATQKYMITKAEKEQDVKYSSREATSLDKSISELSSDSETSNTELAAVMEYNDKLKKRCIAKPEPYEMRRKRREAELAGLKEALSIIESEAALVQAGGRRGRHMRGALLASASQ